MYHKEKSYKGQYVHLYIAMSLLYLLPGDNERREHLQQENKMFLPRIVLVIRKAPCISDTPSPIGYQVEINTQLPFSVC